MCGTGAIMEVKKARDIVAKWAKVHPEIKIAILYGSRVESTHGPESDLDVAVVLDETSIDLDKDNPLSFWIFNSDDWQAELQEQVPHEIHLELYEPRHSQRVASGTTVIAYVKK